MAQHPFPRLVDVVLPVQAQLPSRTPLELAYERVRAEIAAVADDDIAPLNVDIPSVVTTAQAAVPSLREHRDTLAKELLSFDLVQFDKLLDYADALAYLQTDSVHRDAPVRELPAMYDEAMSFRETVISVGRVLAKLRLIDSAVFDAAGSVTGYRNVAYELGNLCTRLLETYPAIAGRSALTEEQLVRGKILASELLAAVARRERLQAASGTVSKERLRAFTLLMRAYNEARRAIVYLRWNEGDADVIAPSFYAGRGGSKKRETAAPSPEVAPAERSTANTKPAEFERAPSMAAASEPKRDSLFAPPSDEPFINS